jgi:ribosomal protein S27E
VEWRRAKRLNGSSRRGPSRTAYDRGLVIAFLLQHLPGIMASPRMVKPLKRILSYQIVLQHMAHSEPAKRSRPGRCPKCHMVNTLVFDSEDELIHCGHCALVITEQEYDLEVVNKPDAAVAAETRRALGLEDA